MNDTRISKNKLHDKYLRASMQNMPVARAFFQHHLPDKVLKGLDLDTLKLKDGCYIDKDLQETLSDIVYDCRYKENKDSDSNGGEEAKIVLLVEHQSTADPLMAFRVYHYMLNLCSSEVSAQRKR